MTRPLTLTVRLNRAQTLAFDNAYELDEWGPETKDEVAARWIVERMGRLVDVFASLAWPTAEEAMDHRERLRKRYLPDDVWALFVVARQAEGGSFYEAGSPLYRSVRHASERVHGPLSDGSAFLDWFRGQRFWLWDVPPRAEPGRRGRPRRDAADDRVLRLARQMRELRPDTIYGIASTMEPVVRQAANLASIRDGDVFILPSHLGPSRVRFIDELARLLALHYPGREPTRLEHESAVSRPSITLNEAMVSVLTETSGGPVQPRARE